MQPSQGVRATQVSELFKLGQWEELEEVYREVLENDPSDAKTAFSLANVLVYRGRFADALPLYDLAWTHRWPGALPLNNKGVALACLGETRAALKAFSDAWENECRPALFNLGILLEKLGDEGSLPDVIVDLNLGARDKASSALAKEKFEKINFSQAAGDPWASTGAAERPLFLWLDDLKPGFGFEPVAETVNVSEAYELYKEGLALLERQEWDAAIAKLEAAADLHPQAFAERIRAPRTRAEAGIARGYLAEVRQRWDAKDFDGANQAIAELVARGSTFSDRTFAEEVLAAGIHDLAQRVRSQEAKDGLEPLQRLITAARQRTQRWDAPADEREAAPGEPEPAGTRDAEPPAGQAGTEKAAPAAGDDGTESATRDRRTGAGGAADPDNGGDLRFDSAEYIRSVCRGAWGKRIHHLLATGDFSAAAMLLEFPEIEWFAGHELPYWRRQVFTAKAEILRARGTDCFGRREWLAAANAWGEGREAAVRAEDPRVVDSFDSLIGELLDTIERGGVREETRVKVRAAVAARDDIQALKRLAAELELNPGDARLRERRQALLTELLTRASEGLEARQWSAVRQMAEAILAAVPEEMEAMSLRRRAEQGLVSQHLEQAQDALDRGLIEEAEKFCAGAAELDPDHEQIAPLRRALVAVRATRSRTEEGPSAYERAYEAFLAARAAVDTESALTQALEMKRLDPRAAQTREALGWLPGAYVESLRVQLERERTADTANALRERLKRLFYLQPDCEPARELSRELRQTARDYSNRKRQASYEKLDEAEEALLDGRSEAALEALRSVREPDLAGEVAEKRREAMAMLAQGLDELLASPKEVEREKAAALLSDLHRWDPEAASAKQQEIQDRDAEGAFEASLDGKIEALAKKLRDRAGHPFRALRELDRTVRMMELEGFPVRSRRRRELHELRQRALRAMTPLRRAAAWLYDRYYSTEIGVGEQVGPDREAKEGASR